MFWAVSLTSAARSTGAISVTGSRLWLAWVLSSSLNCRMSLTSAIIRCASLWMRAAKVGTSAGFAMPVSISSA